MSPPPPRVASDGRPDDGLVEVADRVWVAQAAADAPGGVNATLVAGEAGVLVVDAAGDGDLLRTTVRRLGRGPLLAVVLTHAHPGHASGVAGLLARDDVPVVVHEAVAGRLAGISGAVRLRELSSVTAVDLGDRVVEVVHPGCGHSDGDVVVRVPDTGVLAVGDLVAGSGVPSYGPECWPLAWPASLDLVLQLMGDRTGSAVAVPGHGPLLDRSGVAEQRDGIASVAEAVRELAGRGVPEDRALTQGEAEGSWPWPSAALAEAVRRGYAQLPRSARQLPLA